jgi:hypothetical protein
LKLLRGFEADSRVFACLKTQQYEDLLHLKLVHCNAAAPVSLSQNAV